MKIVTIKKGNEVLELHINDLGYFLRFGAEAGGKSNMYEMSLEEQDVKDIKKALETL